MRTESELRDALDEMVARTPAGDGLLRVLGARPRARTARRTFVLVGVSVGVVGVALACTWAFLMPNRTAVPVAPATTTAAWTMTYRVSPPTGWRISQQEVYRGGVEQTILRPTGSDPTGSGPTGSDPTAPGVVDPQCSVVVHPGTDGSTTNPGAAVTLGGRSGVYVTTPADQEASFDWTDDAGVPLQAFCLGVADPQAQLAAIVRGVGPGQHDLVVPFSVAGLPEGLEVKAVHEAADAQADTQGIDVGDSDDPQDHGNLHVYLWDADPLDVSGGEPSEQVTVGDRDAVFVTASGALCFPGRPTVCVSDSAESSEPAAPGSEKVRQVFAAVRPAADLTDDTTWPLATGSLPR